MAGSGSTVRVSFIGDATSLARASKQAEGDLGKVGSAASGAGTKTKVLAVAGVGAITAFAKGASDKFAEVGRESVKLQRYMGGTIEDASRLRFAAEETGVGVDDLAKGLGKFSKTLVGAGDKTKKVTSNVQVATGAWRKQTTIVKDAAGHFQKLEKMVPVTRLEKLTQVVAITNPLVAKLGFEIKDAHGKLLPMAELLPKVAEKFKDMPNGTEKTALALQLFGKSGMALMPFLNKGAAGIEELTKESDKFGNTLNAKDTAALKANTIAKRQWHATITGVQIQLGRGLLPMMTNATKRFQMMTRFVQQNSAVIKPLVAALAILATVTFAVNKAMAAGRSVQMAYVAVKRLFVTTTNAETGAQSKGVIVMVAQKLATAASAVATGVLTAAQWALNVALNANPIALVIIGLVALAAGFVYAFNHVKWFHDGVMSVFNWIKGHWPLLLAIITGPIGIAVLIVVRHWNAIKSAAAGVLTWIKGHWPVVLAILTGPFGLAVLYISRHWDSIVSTVKGLPKRITSAASGMWDGIKNAFRDALNWIIRKWNDLSFKVKIPNSAWGIPIPGGGSSIGVDTPNITPLAEGGIVRRRPGGMLAQIGEGRYDEAVVPLDGKNRGGGGRDQRFIIELNLEGRTLQTLLLRYKRESGQMELGIA